jgi:SpoVK/Ycf46/Vps4 family AAA+-type ATPase
VSDPLTDIAEIQNQKDKLLEGSCSWVLKNAAYIEWINSNCSKVLWIHGKPGKGKTMIAISLIESLHSNISNSSLGAYIFCDNTIDKRNTTLAVMKSLLYQILS